MFDRNVKINPKLFDLDVKQKPTRDGYGEGLVIAGEAKAAIRDIRTLNDRIMSEHE